MNQPSLQKQTILTYYNYYNRFITLNKTKFLFLIIEINSSKNINDPNCHKLNLSLDKRDLYAWGSGFEGQLGIRMQVQTTANPLFLDFFYNKTVRNIACGAYHSMAITEEGKL